MKAQNVKGDKVHSVTPSKTNLPGHYSLNCTGRTVSDMVKLPDDEQLTCAVCRTHETKKRALVWKSADGVWAIYSNAVLLNGSSDDSYQIHQFGGILLHAVTKALLESLLGGIVSYEANDSRNHSKEA